MRRHACARPYGSGCRPGTSPWRPTDEHRDIPSASGDCLLVTSNDGKRLLVDAGLPEAYDAYIAKPLSKLRDAGQRIDVAYVSHIDRDHIGGILRLLEDSVKWRAYDHMQAHGGGLKKPV